jgi:hypothetical protein
MSSSSINSCLLIVWIALLSGSMSWAVQTPETIKVEVDPSTIVSRISPDFIGFGYETSAVAQPNYFTAKNTQLVNLYRTLSTDGLIRIGGNVSDNTQYIPDGTPVAKDFRQVSIINRQGITNLGEFAKATGWKVMWGLNLGHGTRDQAVQEAVAVSSALGPQLHSFQVGNEVEVLRNVKGKYETYHGFYLDYKGGIRAVLPNAPFSGPDSIGHWNFVKQFAADESKDMKLLTHHYYCSDAHDPKATMEKMLSHDAKFETRLIDLHKLCEADGISYRINEVNSFSGGGKPGVSDTFGSALWALDYMFMLASNGCDGINLETDINHLAFISYYSPIVHSTDGTCSARPEYYGMLAFSMAGKGDILKLDLSKTDINLSAYATRDAQGSIWVTVVNKDLSRDAAVNIQLPDGFLTADAYRLSAPSIDSKDQVTFAHTAVRADGTWSPGAGDHLAITAGVAGLAIPHESAAVVCLRK